MKFLKTEIVKKKMTNASSLCVILGATVQTNSTILYEHNYRNFVIGISIINGLLSPVAVVANVFILFSLWKTFSLHSVSNILVASLAMADLCVGLLLQPMLVYLMNTRLVATFCVVFKIQMFLAYLFTALSLGTLTYLSIERAVAIHWPLRYHELSSDFKKSGFCCNSALGIPDFDFVNHLVRCGKVFNPCRTVCRRSTVLYFSDLLQL